MKSDNTQITGPQINALNETPTHANITVQIYFHETHFITLLDVEIFTLYFT